MSSVRGIASGAFDSCDGLTNLTLPASLRELGLDDLPPKVRAGLSYDVGGFMVYQGWVLDFRNRNAAAVSVPAGVVGIGRGAFAEMYDLETVTLPETLGCIAEGAFEGCTYIQELSFPSALRHVGAGAFRGCSSLLRAVFPDGIETLGEDVFGGCWRMQSVRLPATVASIGEGAFAGCSRLTGATVPTHVKTMRDIFPDAYAQIASAVIAEGETAIMDGMFAGCAGLGGTAIPETVTNVGARAFQDCVSIESVVLPDGVETLGASAFAGCTALWNVTLSRRLSALPDFAFDGCSMLETMIVPASVERLGKRFFGGRTNPAPGVVVANALYYLGNAPAYDADAYAAVSGGLTTYVAQGSRGWDGRAGSRTLPDSWLGHPITFWTPNRFDVSFDANGGTFDAAGGTTWSEQQITDTGYALPSAEPSRPGWAFAGWWTEATGGAQVTFATRVTATRAHTLYAHWRSLGSRMTATFNANGGTVVVPGSQEYVPGQTFGQFPVPTRRGYAFLGWWTEAVNDIRMTEATEVPAADMELFAHWSPVVYRVRFHANGGVGSMSDQAFTYDVRQALATHAFTRAGFAFSGWATTPSGIVRYAENAVVVNLEETQDAVFDLYAVWSGAGYSVRFDSNGGTGIMDNQTIGLGETQNLWPCVFARAGYSFAGWALTPTGAVAYRDGEAVRNLASANGETVALYAVWTASGRTVRLTFDANGGSVSPAYWDCTVGAAVEAFPVPTRPGFTFAGWFTAKTGGTAVASIARVTAAQTLYAHWDATGEVVPGDNACTVAFNANGGSVAETTRKVESGGAVGDLPVPARAGFVFAGWFTAALGGTQVSADTAVRFSVTYYARWTAAWTVTLNANGGTVGTDRVPVAKGKAVGALEPSVREGYAFAGWYTKKSGGTKITAKTKVTKNVTWYAHWTARKYAVKVVKEGKGTVGGAGSKAYRSKVTLKAKAASGFVFQGWYEARAGGAPSSATAETTETEVLVSRKAAYAFTVPLGGRTLVAKFITKAADKAGIGLTFAGVGVGASADADGDGRGATVLPGLTNTCGVVIAAVPVAAAGLTPTSVTVTGLPKGLKYDAAKRAITGTPTAAKTYTAKVTVKSLGASRAWTVKWTVAPMPAFARGTFNGWTWRRDEGIAPYQAMDDGRAASPLAADANDAVDAAAAPVRKVTVSVTAAGKISAKVGSYSFARTGWTVGDDGLWTANLRTVRTVGTGKKAKKYTDVLALALDPAAAWTDDQVSGVMATFAGTVSLAEALVYLGGSQLVAISDATSASLPADATSFVPPMNADTVVSARRNPFGDNAEAKAVAAELAAQGARTVTDADGLRWTVKVATSGVATLARTTGSGKNKKTVSATAVVAVSRAATGGGGTDVEAGDGAADGYTAFARFAVSGKIIDVMW